MSSNDALKVLVVGAGGFVGGFLVEEGLKRGFEVWAGVRESTSREWLTDKRIHFAVLDFSSEESLTRTLADSKPEDGPWDFIIYNLGATKCLSFTDFNKINYIYLRMFTTAIHNAGLVPKRMLYISSLSSLGPGDERNYTPFTENTIPQPNTRYGASKLKAEMWLTTCAIPYVVLRSTGIYGPRDRDYLLMFKAMEKGFDFSVGFRPQMLSFIYVEDLARAAYDALQYAPEGETYNVAEPVAYSQKEFRKIAAEALGKRLVIPIRMPLWAVKFVSTIAEKIGVAKGKPSTLNRDKYNIMKQRNWKVDVSKARKDFRFSPETDLRAGVSRTVNWYRKEGWL